MTPQEITKRWKEVEKFISKIKDPILANAIRLDYQFRAEQEWGYCPAKVLLKESKFSYDDLQGWEKDFYDKILIAQEYNVFEKDETVLKETKARMQDMMEKGLTYTDIPECIRDDSLYELWLEALDEFLEKKILIYKKNKKN